LNEEIRKKWKIYLKSDTIVHVSDFKYKVEMYGMNNIKWKRIIVEEQRENTKNIPVQCSGILWDLQNTKQEGNHLI
jgi:hypothetical protein